MRKVPITARHPQPGEHLTTRTADDGQTWRHGIFQKNGMVRAANGREQPYAAFGDTGWMVYVVEGPGTLAEIDALPVTHDVFYNTKL